MLNKNKFFLLATFSSLSFTNVQAQQSMDLSTLFTTPQERQIINNNRYKTEKKPIVKAQPQPIVEPALVREIVKEEVNASYKISGISINLDGADIAWVNGKMYENGDTMEDGAKVNINNQKVKSVTIKTPDGNHHTATSGETLDITYMRVVEE